VDVRDVLVDERQIHPVGCQRRERLQAVERQPVALELERPHEQAVNLFLAELRADLGVDVPLRVDDQRAKRPGHNDTASGRLGRGTTPSNPVYAGAARKASTAPRAAHSWRSVAMGLTAIALRAGTNAAASATPIMASGTTTYSAGAFVEMPPKSNMD